MDSSVFDICKVLVALGRLNVLRPETVLAALPSLASHQAVCRLVDVHHQTLSATTDSLPPDERVALVRAIAMLEQAVGGMGSVSAVLYLLPILGPERREALALALQDTPPAERRCNAWGKGAVDLEDYDRRQMAKASRISAHIDKVEREQAAKGIRRTESLRRAIRNKDVVAVRGLLQLGADPFAPDSSGQDCFELAKQVGVSDILQALGPSPRPASGQIDDE